MGRPWENVGPRPWELAQPEYPRLVTISRPNANSAPGARGYAGLTKGNETLIVSGLPASIQMDRNSGKPDAGVPSDSYNRAAFNIFIPASATTLGVIEENMVATDDQGKRYQISAADWTPQGYVLSTDLLSP